MIRSTLAAILVLASTGAFAESSGAGRTFQAERGRLRWATALGVLLSLLSATSLAFVAAAYRRTERRRREEAARAASGETVRHMAAMVAHEIRNPLTVMRATLELMRERTRGQLTERDRAALSDVMGEVDRLARLTEDFLDLAADRPLDRSTLKLSEVIATAAAACSAQHPDVRLSLQADPELTVVGDPHRLRQVLSNLLTNAAQAAPHGEIMVLAQVAAGQASIRVRDHGKGIDPEIRDKLFEAFATSKKGGTGLGLVISRRIVERHGGTLRLVEDGADGATFEVTIPLRSQG